MRPAPSHDRPTHRRAIARAASLVALVAAAVALLAAPVARARLDDERSPPGFVLRDRPSYALARISRAPTLDEFLDMHAPADLAAQMTRIEGFVQQSPQEGRPITRRTVVWLGYDQTHLHAVFVAYDDPEGIRANLSRREDLNGDDIVEIQLDTYHDQRRAYSFIVNPLGVQTDAIWFEGSGFDFSWDTVWESEGRLTDEGFVVRIAIPFKSLRFPSDGGGTWGVVLARDIQRLTEYTYWPRIDNRIEGRLNQAATLTGIEGISPGRNFQVIPFATARNFRATDLEEGRVRSNDFDPDAGVDAKWVLRDRYTLDLTANPDYSQVESDAPQVTVNRRFEVFFPEKRPFFLENATYFQTPINLLFTRRIADPRAGVRLTGKSGPNAFGALVIDDEAPGELVDATDPRAGGRARFDVFRYSRDLGRQSNVGALYTGWRFGDSRNRVGSIDGRFKFDDQWSTSLQAVHSETRLQGGERLEDQAYNVALNRNGRGYNAHFHYYDVGPEFATEAGFVNRVDVRDLHQDHSYTFWTEGKRLISWTPGLFVQHIEDHEGQRLDRTVQAAANWQFQGQTSLRVAVADASIRLRPRDFPALAQVTRFDGRFAELSLSTRPTRSFDASLGLSAGDGVNFVPPDGVAPTSTEERFGSLSLGYRPSRRVRLDTTYLFTQIDDAASSDRVLTDQIVRTRAAYQITRKLSLRAIVQFERGDVDPARTRLEDRRRINGDLLLTYLVNPWTAFYLGTNSNYTNRELIAAPGGPQAVTTGDAYRRDSRQVFFKLSYLFRI